MIDFNTQNLYATTSAVTVDSNTILAANIFNPNTNFQYYSSGFNNDLTSTSVTITFDVTTTISRLAILEHNFKGFSVFYNGSTANSITLSNANTTTLAYTSNSETSHYFRFGSLAVSSVTLQADSTIEADLEKVLGFLYVGDNYLEFDRIPSARDYKPNKMAKQIVHKMSDGGTQVLNIDRKFEIDLKYKHLETAERDSLETIYNLESPFYFCPFGTTTSWDQIFFEANWIGDFDFNRYSDNAVSAGFTGQIKLRET